VPHKVIEYPILDKELYHSHHYSGNVAMPMML